MIQSMTGFASRAANVAPVGKITVELRSTNHKFLETVFHLPEGFIALEEKMKKEIESRIKRGRITCVVNIIKQEMTAVSVNRRLLKDYVRQLKMVQKDFGLNGELQMETLLNLPGVMSLGSPLVDKPNIWPALRALVDKALEDLVRARVKEGRALFGFLKKRAQGLESSLASVKGRFAKALKRRLESLESDEERSSFLKSSDIAEELERLEFHIRNFKNKLAKSGAVGKELDFIAQEMQREANTMAAKMFDAAISAKVVQIKSSIEKVREQVQNIE